MTREEIIKGLNDIAPKKPKSEWGRCQREIVDEAINALQTEPCEDCISRRAVLMELDKYLCGVPFDEKGIDEVIKELPPVTPQSKTGYISIADVMSVFDDFMCGEVDEDGTETFLEMLKDKAESEDAE